MTPATSDELELGRRVDELARLGYDVELDRVAGLRISWEGRGGGMPWRASLSKPAMIGMRKFSPGFGRTGGEALEDAIDQARREGAP